MCAFVCVWSEEDEQNIESFLEGRERGGDLGLGMIGDRAGVGWSRWHHIVHTCSCGHCRCVVLERKISTPPPRCCWSHTTQTDEHTDTDIHTLKNVPKVRQMPWRHMQFESFVNYCIAIPFYKFSHVFFFCSLRFILFRRAHTHTHTQHCWPPLLLLALSDGFYHITSHR